jgi:hypothetical protein
LTAAPHLDRAVHDVCDIVLYDDDDVTVLVTGELDIRTVPVGEGHRRRDRRHHEQPGGAVIPATAAKR